MQDFYEEERKQNEGLTRRFTFCGEEFIAKPFMSGEDISTMTDIGIDGDNDRLSVSIFPRMNSVIRNTLTPESRELWDKTLAVERPVPISIMALTRVANWLLTEEAGRPTAPLSSSGTSGGSGSTTSTDGSDSKAAPASATSPSVPV